MADGTKISWTDATFNPWLGCEKVSPGCRLCYANAQEHRWGNDFRWGQGKPRTRTSPKNWLRPVVWNAQSHMSGVKKKVFCGSFCDWADPSVLEEWRKDLFDLIKNTPMLEWQLLTKRADQLPKLEKLYWPDGPLENVWLGITIEDRKRGEERMPFLLKANAAIKWISIEPQLEYISLYTMGAIDFTPIDIPECEDNTHAESWFKLVDWVVVGGESGNKKEKPLAAQFELDWADDILHECKLADVAFFFKQTGSRCTTTNLPGKGDDPSLWPKRLQVQEFPR
jgi:protein gp37